MPQNNLLNYLQRLFKKPKRDWSKSDREVLDNFVQLRKRQEALQISPLNQSTYNDRRFLNDSDPNYQGPMTFAGQGTSDHMPGTTPSLQIKPKHIKKPMGGKKSKTSNLI